MSEKIKALADKRGASIARARQISDLAQDRAFSAEEQANYDSAMGEVMTLKTRMDAELKLGEEEKAAAGSAMDAATGATDIPGKIPGKSAFAKYLLSGVMTPEIKNSLRYDQDSQGGFLGAPAEFVNSLIIAVNNAVFVRSLATKHQLKTSDTLGIPSLDSDPADAAWTSEIGSASEDASMAFGKRELKTVPLTKLIKVSQKLLRLTDAEAVVLERLAYKFGVTMENKYLNGSGANEPLGMFTASNNGIPTTRDVAADNKPTTVTADGLLNAKWSLKAQYLKSAQWIAHRDFYKLVSKLKDAEGQYLWAGALTAGVPDMLCGRPINMSEYAPNTFTTGLYVAVLGDISYYHIADSLDVTIQRLNELYAGTSQVGFIGRAESDGMPVLGEAFARIKLA